MTARRVALIGVLFCATAAAVGWLFTVTRGRPACVDPEPCYQGRTLAQWRSVADDQSAGRNVFERYDAINALTHFGPPAVSVLADTLRDPSPSIRAHTARALGGMGPAAKDAVPALLEVWKEPDDFTNQTPVEAAQALGQIGAPAREAVPALTDVLRNPNYRSNKPRAALNALRGIGPPARDAVPVLVDLLPGPLGFQSAETLNRIDPESETTRRLVVAAWVRMLEDPEHADQFQLDRAADGLAKLGPEGLPILAQLLAKRGLAQRRRIVEVLGRYGPAAVPALTMALMDPDVDMRSFVPGALQAARAAGVPALVQALKDTDSGVRMNAALALGRIGAAARDAAPALVARAEDDAWPGVRMQAIDAIGLIGPAAKATAPRLRHVLTTDPDPEVRRRTEAALKRIESH